MPTFDHVLVCGDSPAQAGGTTVCNGPQGLVLVYLGYLDAYSVVTYRTYSGPTPGGCTTGTVTNGMAPVNQLPPGACLLVYTADGANLAVLPASNFAFSSGSGYQPPFSLADVDTTVCAGAFGAGFTIVATCWLIGKTAGTVMKAFKEFMG